MRVPRLQILGILVGCLVFAGAAPILEESESKSKSESKSEPISFESKLDSFEFNHPSILPQHPENFKVDNARTRKRQSLYDWSTRLPANLFVLSYNLWIQPYFPSPGVTYPSGRNFTFDGNVTILVEVLEDSDRFVVNAAQLNVESVIVTNIEGDNIPVASTSQDDTTQQLSIITSTKIQGGELYNINIVYSGMINPPTDGSGVYYTSYTDPQGAQHYMIATLMKPFSARQVFPCLDEPSYKARFTISLTYPSAHVALSNMMESAATVTGDGWSTVKFPETPMMSTYLVAFAVGPYVSTTFTNQHNTLTRAWGWPGTEQYLQFAAENAGHCLYRLGEYTGIRYPLPKADLLGMPEFIAGAVENWGLMIYKYQYIAYNPTTMTTRDMAAASKALCHEMAHQWFGDLVTAAWWDDLFLNEGFADYFMTFIRKFVYPKQATFLDTLQILQQLQAGLNADILPDAHPVVYPDGPAFDEITYSKGASILRMLSDVLGANVFQQGIQEYLKKNAYSNVQDIDFTNAMSQAAADHGLLDWCESPLNVTDFLAPYLYQSNFPLITYYNNQNSGGSYFTQEPFGSTDNLNATAWGYKWTIPLTTSSLRQSSPHRLWLPAKDFCFGEMDKKKEAKKEKSTVRQPRKRALQWELTSVTTATYGRIIYDDIGFDRVIQTIKQNDISDNVKLQLIADEYYYMYREIYASRPYSYDRVLNLALAILNTPSFIKTPSSSVFTQVQIVLEEVSKNYRDTLDNQMLPRLYKKMFQSTYNQLQWNDTGLWDTDVFSELFLPIAVRYDIGDVESRTLAMFANVKAACGNSLNGTAWCNPYSTNLRKAIYCGAAKYAPNTSDFFFRMLHAYNQEVVTNPYFYQEYMALLEGMACTQQSATLKTLIRLFVNSPLDPNTLFGFLKPNPAASDALYNYLSDNPQIVSSPALSAFLDAMTYNWNSYARNLQFADLMNSLDLDDTQYEIFEGYMDTVNLQWEYRESYGIKIINWLYDNLVVIGKTPWEKVLKNDISFPTYELSITTNIPGSGPYQWYENMTFTGDARITFNVIKPISVITINAHRLVFDKIDISVFVSNDDGSETPIDTDDKNIKKDYDRGLLYIPFANGAVLRPKVYILQINYIGFIFQNPNEGPASNTYFGGLNGKKGWIFTTDFEGGPGARSLLPCWDEPTYKGEFVVTVMHPTDMIALSNSMEAGTEVYTNGWSTTKFASTDEMSSYLLAICVGHFANLAKVSNIGTLTRMWTWAGMEQYGELALNVTVGTIEFMSDYFSFDYPLIKLDVMALPEYTDGAGAMENFGLIIGEYSLFMVDPAYATTQEIAQVAKTAAHEVVHQWFGDTVTLDWWNDIFLNEGFAQYWFANGVNRTFPEQEGYAIDYNRFYINHVALKSDCIPGIAKPVISDIPPIFGVEPYYKGSALLNLLNNVLTPPIFQEGLVGYLLQYGYGNASPQNLWDSLTLVAKANKLVDWNGQPLDVSSFMNQYTLQTSYPVVTLTLRGTSTVQATQQSCMGGDNLWNVPLFTQTQDSTTFNWFVNQTGGNDSIWLRPLPSNFRVDNAGSTSFARINYDDKSWYSIQAQLVNNYKFLSATSRAMLLDDARFFYESGQWDMTKFLDLTLYLVNEDSLAPWEQAIGFFTDMLNRFQYQPNLATVQNYVIQITSNAHQSLEYNINGIWTNDRMIQLHVDVNNLAANRLTRMVAQSKFNTFLLRCQYSDLGTGSCSGIHPNLRPSSYCYGLMQSNKDIDFVNVQNLYQWFVDNGRYLQTDGVNLLNALGCSQNRGLINLLMDDILDGNYPPSLLTSIALHDTSGRILFEYLNDNTQLVLYAPFDFSVYIRAMFTNWSTQTLYNMGASYEVTTNWDLLSSTQQTQYRSGLAGVQANIDWMTANENKFVTWIQKNFGAVNV